MVMFTSYCKEAITAVRLRVADRFGRRRNLPGSPNERQPLRSGHDNVDFSTVPRHSQLNIQTDRIALDSFNSLTGASNRNSVTTIEMELSDEETSFFANAATSTIKKSSGTLNRVLKKSKAVTPPSAPIVLVPVTKPQVKKSQPTDVSDTADQSTLFKATLDFVRQQFLSRPAPVPAGESCESEDSPVVELIAKYEPFIPFYPPDNRKEERLLRKLFDAQQQLYSVEDRLEKNILKYVAFEADYEHYQGKDVADQKEDDADVMDKLLSGKKIFLQKARLFLT